MTKWTCALGVLAVLAACEGTPADPGKNVQEQGDLPIEVTPSWEWSSGVATDGSDYLVATWRGDSTIVNIYPTATLGTVAVLRVSGTGAVIGSPIDLAQTPGDGAGIYFDGANYVVLYTNGPEASSTVNVQFISPGGARVGSPITLGGGYLGQAIAYGGGTYLFTYTRQGTSSNAGYARTMSASGALGPEIAIAPEPGGAGGAAFDGTNFAVAYARGGATKGVGVKFVSRSGQIVKDVPVATTASVFSSTVLAFNGSTYLLAWDESAQSSTFHVQALQPDGTLVGTQQSVTASSGVRMLDVAAIGANFLVEYGEKGGSAAPWLFKVQEYSPSATPVGSPVDIVFSDGSRPRAVALTQAASGRRVFAALTSTAGKTWDVYGRFIPVP